MKPPLMSTLTKGWREDIGVAGVEGVRYLPDDIRPLRGALASYVGARHTPPDIARGSAEHLSDDDEDDRPELELRMALVRAWPVPSVVGSTFAARDEAALPAALEELLSRTLPVCQWPPSGDFTGPIRKYGIFHAAVSAPEDEETGQPMALELAGKVIAFGGRRVDRPWYELHPVARAANQLSLVPGPIEIRVTVATYANVLYPGIDAPVYW